MNDDKLTFSQRQGLAPPTREIQLGSMDDGLRNGLWNVLTQMCWQRLDPYLGGDADFNPEHRWFIEKIWNDHFNWPIDTISPLTNAMVGKIREAFHSWEWNEVYDFVEFMIALIQATPSLATPGDFLSQRFNQELIPHAAGYRVIAGQVTPITSPVELEQIARALTAPLNVVQVHIAKALEHLSDRSPDYRNSIKESISAVESMCRKVSGSATTLGQALKLLKKKHIRIHSALESAFSKLYGWTSDDQGIRHSLMDESDLDFEDAKFMLVSCSGFVNYLVEKARKANINLT